MTTYYTNVRSVVFGEGSFPIAASAVVNPGDMVAVSSGYAASATATTGLKIVGIALRGDGTANGSLNSNGQIDNSAGSNGAFNLIVDTSWPKSGGRKMFWIGNDGTNPVAAATIGSFCYATSATTVGASSSGLSKAGTVYAFDSVNNLVGVIFDQ